MTILFSFDAIVKPTNFAAGIISPPAAVAKLNPGRPVITEAVRTRDDEPSDADRRDWYFAAEMRAANEIIEADAAEYEALTSMCNGFIHA